MNFLRRTAFLLLILCWTSSFAMAQDNPAPSSRPASPAPGIGTSVETVDGIEIHKDLEYARPDGHPLALDLYIPVDAPKPVPLVIYIHGGGWMSGSKSEGLAKPILKHGFALANIDYRLSQVAIYPAQIYDCKAAVRWLRAHATNYGLSPDEIGAWGESAGGALVSLLGTTANHPELEGDEGNAGVSSQVQAVCDFYGPTNMLTMDPRVANACVPKLLGGPIDQNQDKARAASSLFYVSGKACPFLIAHGDVDPIVPFQQSIDLNDALQKAGVDSSLYVVFGGGHPFHDQGAIDQAITFFERHLKKAP